MIHKHVILQGPKALCIGQADWQNFTVAKFDMICL
jgi:hypothetical protein